MLKGEEELSATVMSCPALCEIMGMILWHHMPRLLVLASIASELKNRRYGAQLLFIAATTLKRRASASLFCCYGNAAWIKFGSQCGCPQSMQVIENALIMMSQTDGIQDADRMTPAEGNAKKS